MSTSTIQIPAEHVDALRRSLLAERTDAGLREEVDVLLGQLDDTPAGSRSYRLTGSRTALWNAIYDSLCTAAEQLADDCNDYWRGTVAPESARRAVADVGARLDILLGLGPPPARER